MMTGRVSDGPKNAYFRDSANGLSSIFDSSLARVVAS
ncbi:hypothetical protein OROMI_000954 [Orobanche minor]